MSVKPDLTLVPGGADAALRWRGLGQVEDLDLVLSAVQAGDRPRAVTAVLCACATPPASEGTIWALTLAGRIGGLLAVWAGDARRNLELQLKCAGCGADLEVALPVSALAEMAQQAEAEPELEIGDAALRLRRPTGEDQRRWREADFADPGLGILETLVVGAAPDLGGQVEALSDQLAEFDPLSCFSVSTTCPDCSLEQDAPVDLEAVLLQRLQRVQAGLFRDVDILARRYGWSDTAILAMPAARRARYLEIALREDDG